MSVLYIVAAIVVAALVFLAGMWYSKGNREGTETMKALVWFIIVNAVAWVWFSYVLAYMGRTVIAESLSEVALTTILGTIFGYAAKSAVENLSKHNKWPDKGGRDDTNA